MASDPSDSKAALRLRLRTLRAALARQLPDAGERAAAWLPAARLEAARIVAGYHPVGSEMDPGPLLRRLAKAGARVVLPVGRARDAPLIFRQYAPGDLVVRDAFGIASPAEDAPELTPDLIIAPVLAFDRRGGRLGQGAGAYDRTLRRLRDRASVFVIGLAFAGQELSVCPGAPHDERLDAILTERGYIEVEEDL